VVAKTILVTGDVFLQENLLVRDGTKLDGGGAFDPVSVHRMPGGACRLADLARAAIGKGEGEHFAVAVPTLPQQSCRTFAVWKLVLPIEGKEVAIKNRVWRIDRYLGAQHCPPTDRLTYEPADENSPSVLLIEDLNLGFRECNGLWPKSLLEPGDGSQIVLRTSAPVGEGPLWQHLLQYRDRLTVVVSADALRARGAGLTAPLSWDQTIEEIAAEFGGTRFANDLALVRRVVVQFGSDGAASFTRLPLVGDQDSLSAASVRFERCLYDPQSLEGAWTAKRPGVGIDGASMLAAAMARHELDPPTWPLFVALGRGLAAIRRSHELGGGLGRNPFGLSVEHIRDVFHPERGEPEAAFYTAFPHSLLDDEKLRDRPASKSDLLRDFTGSGFESVVSTGMDVVFRGIDAALKPVPKATYGKFTTADRDEIERINSIRNLIVGYLSNEKDTRPLSFAVFGPPGSGKSFAVKQVMRDVAGDAATSLEFNLSQMSGLAELHQAFHRVRDASIQNRIPFVFWDEFDTKGLDWLKDFLAPMQDSAFHAGGIQHSFGKAIFIFAGGTAASLAEFNLKKEDPRYDDFKKVKGPDFVSRLRGHIDVKGPNPEAGATGYSHVVRRAILLRKLLESNAPRLIDKETQTLAIDASVLRASLTAKEYVHGARSVEAVVTMSNLARATSFGLAELPTRDLLDMHVSEDFMAAAKEPALGAREIEALAEAAHEAWCDTRRAQGYVYGPERNDKATPPTHPLLRPFKQLPAEIQESNRASVRTALVVLATSGCRLQRANKDDASRPSLDAAVFTELKPAEHNRWLRERLQSGWAWCKKTDDRLRLQADLTHFNDLPPGEAPLDELVYKTILAKLPDLGFVVAKTLSEVGHQSAKEAQTAGQDDSGARS
jgi:hypothetical protein